MITPIQRVEIVDESCARAVELIRYIAYHNSSGFKIVDEDEFSNYYKWSQKDNKAIVLVLFDENNQAVSTLRGNVYFDGNELESNNSNFTDNSLNFIQYPVLDMTFAATHPNSYNKGHISILRYYMYRLHKHAVKTISGTAVKNSNIYKTLKKLGYDFKEIEKVRKEMLPSDTMVIAKLDASKVDTAMKHLKSKYGSLINEIPIIIK